VCSRTNVLSFTSPFSATYYTAYECSKFLTHLHVRCSHTSSVCGAHTSPFSATYYTAYASPFGTV
jgi:hypothetical protein